MRRWFSRFMAVLIALGIALTSALFSPPVTGLPLAATVTPNILWDDYDDPGSFDSNCSLREALHSAMYNINYGGCILVGDLDDNHDTIMLSTGTYTLSISGFDNVGIVGDLDILDPFSPSPPLSVRSPSGPQPDITIQGAEVGTTTINANNIDRAFDIMNTVSVVINNVWILNGFPQYPVDAYGGAIEVEGSLTLTDSTIYSSRTIEGRIGGGISNNGTLTLANVTIFNNSTGDSNSDGYSGLGGGISNFNNMYATDVFIYMNHTGDNTGTGSVGGGGGFWNGGDAVLNRVTVLNNYCGTADTRDGSSGGGIANSGELTIYTSTISGNRSGAGGSEGGDHAGGDGGGIFNSGSGVITLIQDSTIAFNSTGISTGSGSASGGGLMNEEGSVTIRNSILADNDADYAWDCGGGFISSGFNLVESITGCTITGSTDTLTGQDPLLATIADIGAYGYMHGLLPGSPAIDAGPGTCLMTDQRLKSRPVDGNRDGTIACDIGAYEVILTDFLPLILLP